MNRPLLLVLAGAAALLGGCGGGEPRSALSPADSLACVRDNEDHRRSVDAFHRTDPSSPFQRDTGVVYTGIRWFPIDPRYCVSARLERYADPQVVTIMGTKGEPREQVRYGYFDITVPGDDGTPVPLRLNVYRFAPSDSIRYARFRNHLSMWFTDRTTGNETYHVGRYLELGEEHPDPAHAYRIDLNKAFNPYCAYSALFSCAIPSDEDRLPIALRVGELTYHE